MVVMLLYVQEIATMEKTENSKAEDIYFQMRRIIQAIDKTNGLLQPETKQNSHDNGTHHTE